jgi:hypothetical protein
MKQGPEINKMLEFENRPGELGAVVRRYPIQEIVKSRRCLTCQCSVCCCEAEPVAERSTTIRATLPPKVSP